MRRALATITLLIALGLGGAYAAGAFGGSTQPNSAPAPARPLSVKADLRLAKHVPCLSGSMRRVGPKVFSRFQAATAVLCTDGFHVYRRKGQWEVLVRKVAVSGIPAFQRYFEQPDESNWPPKNEACSAVLVGIFVPVFVDANGRTLVPRTPLDRCHQPIDLRKEGKLAAQVRWHVVSVHKVKLIVSAKALAADCPMKVGNTVAWAGPPHNVRAGTPLFDRTPRKVRICVYRTPRNNFAVGQFVRGFHLDAARTRRLLGALNGPGPKRGCPKQRNFADIGGGPRLGATVELGGCYRVERPDRTAGTAKPAVIRGLLGVR